MVGFVDDTRYAGQASLWGSLATWRAVTAQNRPGRAAGDTAQALVVRADGTAPGALAGAIDDATGGATTTLTVDAAIEALPGVSQQRSTFDQIIGVTLVVALVVVALFFALITVERIGLYGILKAVGASGATLFAGVVAQAVVVTLAAPAVGLAGSLALDSLVPAGGIPFDPTPGRLAASVALLLAAAVAGCAISLRRVLRIDPASAIGAASWPRRARRSRPWGRPRPPSTWRACARSTGPVRARSWPSTGPTVGFVFQFVNLVPFLTARENLLVVDELAGRRRRGRDAARRADQLLDELGLADRGGNLPAELSGGQRQRLAIGRALMNDPELVLFDEPTSALDSKTGDQVVQVIREEMTARGTAALIVTHDARIAHCADRTVSIEDGRISG